MLIGIDACCWSNRRGFGRFTRELLTALIPRCGAHDVHLVVDRQTASACTLPAEAKVCVVNTRQQPTQAASATGARSVIDLWRMHRAITRLGPDVFFFPAVYSFFPLPGSIPTAVVFTGCYLAYSISITIGSNARKV